jgi:hypothetical protein
VFDRNRPKILEAQQRFIGRLANVADGLQACGCQHVPYACGKPDICDQRVVGQFGGRIHRLTSYQPSNPTRDCLAELAIVKLNITNQTAPNEKTNVMISITAKLPQPFGKATVGCLH